MVEPLPVTLEQVQKDGSRQFLQWENEGSEYIMCLGFLKYMAMVGWSLAWGPFFALTPYDGGMESGSKKKIPFFSIRPFLLGLVDPPWWRSTNHGLICVTPLFQTCSSLVICFYASCKNPRTMYALHLILRPSQGVHEVHLRKLLTLYHLSKVITNLCDKGTISIHSRRFLVELLKWNQVYKVGEVELDGPPVVALNTIYRYSLFKQIRRVLS